MGGGGSQSQTSLGSGSSQIVVPDALQPLYKQSANYLQQLQNMIPLWGTTSTVPNAGVNPVSTQTPTTGDMFGGANLYTGDNNALYNLANLPTINRQTDVPTQEQIASGFLYNKPIYGDYSAGVGGQAGNRDVTGNETYYVAPGGNLSNGVYDLEGTKVTPYGNLSSQAVAAQNNQGNLIAITNPDGSVGYYNPGDVTTTQTTPNFLSSNPMQTAPVNPLQLWAAQMSPDIYNTPDTELQARLYATMAPSLAGRMATGAGVGTDPAILEAVKTFEANMAPQIENQMGLAGLGKSSSLANSLALAKSNYMLPLIQDYINREQGVLANEANMYASMVPQLTTLGGSETTRRLQAINAAMQGGTTLRAIEQEPLTAQYQDFLRRQALAEQALFVPFGATATASIGPESQYSQTSSGSGVSSSPMK